MLTSLLNANEAWASAKVDEDPQYFSRLADLQEPQYLWIGCSDSRVPANVITGLEPGEVFVHRNVANLIHRSDLNLLSVVEYAVATLGVKHIIVCGHYGCGGIEAAMDGCSHGVIDHWLQPVRDVAETNCDELNKIDHREGYLARLCELSVIAQVEGLASSPIVQTAWRQNNPLAIHGWIYGLSDGRLRDLLCSRRR